MSEIMRIWENEDDQLKALLQPWDKDSDQPEDLDRVRKGLENLKEEGRVPERLVYLLVANCQILPFHHFCMPKS